MRSSRWYSICSSDRLYNRLSTRIRTMVSVGYGGRRTATLKTVWPRCNAVNYHRQCGKIDARIDLCRGGAQNIKLISVMCVGKQVGLDGAAAFHGISVGLKSQMATVLPEQERLWFFEVPFICSSSLSGYRVQSLRGTGGFLNDFPRHHFLIYCEFLWQMPPCAALGAQGPIYVQSDKLFLAMNRV